ncbi:hypothetical_protein [Leishmania braziliensis MHOM/BR/75/M2904]|uniref:Hypothetical_protein n=1 Tax=Leishmania braziliensis MHOM/BR/75/M2904 TaxID=420245 RepID=A0A3P3ZEY9_LEIBR|nr:hypothetical_protein [Leishmania braziliensis MHOM/BR/75/M2904]
MRLSARSSSARGSASSVYRRVVARWDRGVQLGVSLNEAASADSGDTAGREAEKDDEDNRGVGRGTSPNAANGSVNTVSATPGSLADDPLRLSSYSSPRGLSAVREVKEDGGEDVRGNCEARLWC